jgi:hypothetical protein
MRDPLFLHAKEGHFPDEFESVQVCIAKLEPLLLGLRQFANECADKVAGATSLQRTFPAAAGSTEFADSDFLTSLYIKHLLAHDDPSFEEKTAAADVMELTIASGAIVVARGTSAAVTSWRLHAQELMSRQWCPFGKPA